jgi:hypothetical protein
MDQHHIDMAGDQGKQAPSQYAVEQVSWRHSASAGINSIRPYSVIMRITSPKKACKNLL